jgi:hypothetical protein
MLAPNQKTQWFHAHFAVEVAPVVQDTPSELEPCAHLENVGKFGYRRLFAGLMPRRLKKVPDLGHSLGNFQH